MKILDTSFETVKTTGLVAELMAKHKIPGATMAVVRGGEVVWSQAYGVRNEQGTPIVTLVGVYSSQFKKRFYILFIGIIETGCSLFHSLFGEAYIKDLHFAGKGSILGHEQRQFGKLQRKGMRRLYDSRVM